MSAHGTAKYSRHRGWSVSSAVVRGDELRRLIPVFALAVAVVAALADPSSAADLARRRARRRLQRVGPFPACRSAQRLSRSSSLSSSRSAGLLEPLMFELAPRIRRRPLVAVADGRRGAGHAGRGRADCRQLDPDPAEVAVPIWIMGIAFPDRRPAFARHEQLVAELEGTRRSRPGHGAGRAVAGSRVTCTTSSGTGLPCGWQVTSARHVLRRTSQRLRTRVLAGGGGASKHAGASSAGRAAAQGRRDGRRRLFRRWPRFPASSRRHGPEVSPSTCTAKATRHASHPASASRPTESPRRRWPTQLATRAARATVLGLELTNGQVELVAETR